MLNMVHMSIKPCVNKSHHNFRSFHRFHTSQQFWTDFLWLTHIQYRSVRRKFIGALKCLLRFLLKKKRTQNLQSNKHFQIGEIKWLWFLFTKKKIWLNAHISRCLNKKRKRGKILTFEIRIMISIKFSWKYIPNSVWDTEWCFLWHYLYILLHYTSISGLQIPRRMQAFICLRIENPSYDFYKLCVRVCGRSQWMNDDDKAGVLLSMTDQFNMPRYKVNSTLKNFTLSLRTYNRASRVVQ